MSVKLSAVKCQSYERDAVFEAVKKALGLLGGTEKFISPGSKVLVKPNLLLSKEPEAAVTTHPEVFSAVVRILKGIDCKVVAGDGPSVWGKYIENIDAVYEATGIKKVCLEEGVELIEFKKRRMRDRFPLASVLDECDYYVNIPKFKTHNLTLLTGAVKNNYGLVAGTFKTELHKNYFDLKDFSDILLDIYLEAKPALTIVDGILALEGDGPGTKGKPRQADLVLAGKDCVAIDSVLAFVMGLKPHDVMTNLAAFKRKIGETSLNNIEVLGEDIRQFRTKPFLLPSAAALPNKKLPKAVLELAKKLIRYYPCVERDNCIACSACIKACPVKAVSMSRKGVVFDYSKCIACFCCQEVCPNAAIKTKKSLFLRLMGL